MHFVMIGVLVSGLEGAIDAAGVRHTDGDSVTHEMHNPHLGHQNDSSPAQESDADHHMCHCSVHIPPLAFGLAFDVLILSHGRHLAASTSHAYLGGPPPLPPPIV